METKFIGLEGFNEIESLSTKHPISKKSNQKKLGTAAKTARFAKRVAKMAAKSTSKKVDELKIKRAASKQTAKIKPAKKSVSVIDKRYIDSRNGNKSEYSSSAKEAIISFSSHTAKKQGHLEPKAHRSSKKRAMLAVIACSIAIMLSCVTVSGAVELSKDSDSKNSVNTETETQATSVPVNYGFAMPSSYDEAVGYESFSDGRTNVGIQSTTTALFVDGKLIGVTVEGEKLYTELEQILFEARADYDDETTTEFANDVEIRNNVAAESLMNADDIISAAKDKLSIALSTDIVYTRETPYETITEYDESQYSDYKKVKTEGKNGEAEVTVRTTFVDGVQTNAVQTDVKVLKEAVDEVVIKGKKTRGTSSYSAASSSSASYSSGGSSSGSFTWPVPYTHSISSYFEWRWGRMHNGIDIAAGGIYGQAIVASDGGVVTRSGDYGDGYGSCVIIDHGNGYTTLYGHCSSLAVSAGQRVSKGQTIGYVGSTGNSTGPHLHFEVMQNSTKLNPLKFVS